MPITSYAQNFEDVILWRALKHVEPGFYIDIGAQDPVVDSVSLAFYEKGWRGVHVEPSADYAEKLRAARPDEEVIQAAVAQEPGEIKFFEIPNTGLSTGNEGIARKHENEGIKARLISVSSQPLSTILSLHGDRDIHWMKIDVEGMEDQVIKSWLPSDARPWVVVVESTKPNSTEPSHAPWEPGLLDIGYDFVYFDGLNRFYLSIEHSELKPHFDIGPNYFDGFAVSATSWFARTVKAETIALRKQLAEESSAKATTEARLAEEQGAKLALENRLAAVYASTSWRITEPMRASRDKVNWLARGIWSWTTFKPGTRPRRVARCSAVELANYLRTRPRLATPAKRLLGHFPALNNHLHAVIQAERYSQAFGPSAVREFDGKYSMVSAEVGGSNEKMVKTALLSIVQPIWRKIWFRIEGRLAPIESRLSSLEQAWHTHISAFLNAMASVPAVSHEVAALSRRLNELTKTHSRASDSETAALAERLEEVVAALSQRADAVEARGKNADAAISSLWERVEFVRRETLFEFNHGSKGQSAPNGGGDQKIRPLIVSAGKFEAARRERRLRLNLGSGHIALTEYINVDARHLPGVDVVADVGDLPFEEHSVDEIFSAHLVEHFPLETMRRRLLPYWRSRLRPGGVFKAVTPDAAAMLQATATGEMPFDDFREVTYGAQDYDGDYHFNLFTPDSLKALLQEAGFKEISVPVAGRRNGKCFEFEIVATAP
ncbi:MAG: FkbM family methyltransferase [Mesorhizobium sp.]|nr:FkbM family methyltransferase [bacterium M00.F.Ca.ET.205.01.1.1]TGU51005.1 FkbM family methyltransferase [bacterium M00.F.Ca.ET.152.01.1.1]TGV34494.1 FkbM family methyltransferase [Mesorhizobium sp. M00.F.Ca.ET.186.01.1.1]TGZ41837.1 FkbM family methyltransferase [bacterium M00.F.Ca.ET.162.01.1.1]TIW62617.1 MAG: FkbM family methyltransferase [Mesorhizobium sp.]